MLLNRGARYPRRQIFNELCKAGFDYIVSLENPDVHYEIDELSTAFPHVKFILLSEKVTLGGQINIAALEQRSPLFFVLWNDLHLLYGVTAAKIAERLVQPLEHHSSAPFGNWFRRLCTVPVFQNAQFEPLPTVISPVFRRGHFETLPYAAAHEDAASIYPFDAAGIYDRQRFLALGGFDAHITHPQWQLMDFGFRAWLWGEEIRCTHHVHLRFDGPPPEISPPNNRSFWHFFLKNLLPDVKQAENNTVYAHLPLKKLARFLLRARESPVRSAGQFFAIRRWVHQHRNNWKISAETLINNWDIREF